MTTERFWTDTPALAFPRHRQPERGTPAKGYGDWWRGHQWTHFITLTTGKPMSVVALERALVRKWLRYVQKVTQGPTPCVYAVEPHRDGRPHLHALLYAPKARDTAKLARKWRYGRAEVQLYDRQRGAAAYTAKGIGGTGVEHGILGGMPPKAA